MAKPLDLQTRFKKEILPKLQKELNIKNIHAVPHLVKVKVNVGIGKVVAEGNKDYSSFVNNVASITGQKPIVTKAKKAISNFKVKKGMPVGVVATLRGKRMFDFINKLVNIILPRVRDFRGLPKQSFDGKGNYNVGIREHTVFPEINPDEIVRLHGIEVTIVTTAKNNEEGYALLKALGFPFKQ